MLAIGKPHRLQLLNLRLIFLLYWYLLRRVLVILSQVRVLVLKIRIPEAGQWAETWEQSRLLRSCAWDWVLRHWKIIKTETTYAAESWQAT